MPTPAPTAAVKPAETAPASSAAETVSPAPVASTASTAAAPAVVAPSTPAPAKTTPPAGTFVDRTPAQEIVSKISYTPEEALAFLAAIDPKGSSASPGKGVRIFAAHVGPKGELTFNIYYKTQ